MYILSLRILATKQTGCACAPPVAFSMSVLKIRLVQALGGTQVSSKPLWKLLMFNRKIIYKGTAHQTHCPQKATLLGKAVPC
jgi:hypothetical protein